MVKERINEVKGRQETIIKGLTIPDTEWLS